MCRLIWIDATLIITSWVLFKPYFMHKKIEASYVERLSKIIEVVESEKNEALTITQVGSPTLLTVLGSNSLQVNVSEIFRYMKA